MVQVVMGSRGTGKTKQVIDMVNAAAGAAAGNVIVIERDDRLRKDISARTARLLSTTEYQICSYQVLRGFITGLCAGNYDITNIFIDSLFKIVQTDCMQECEKFLDWTKTFGKKHNINVCITISADPATASEGLKTYFS